MNEVLLHVDVAGDRVAGEAFAFTGWVVADESIEAIALREAKEQSLQLSARPDVERVFPNRHAIGFAGRSRAQESLHFVIRIAGATLERDHVLPSPLPRRSLGAKILSRGQQAFSQSREHLASGPEERWRLVLQRHLRQRRERGGLFARRHAEVLLGDFAKALPDAAFLQIGANDGRTGDPLFALLAREDLRWHGLLVEPVLHLFSQLAELHQSNPRLRLEQAAIGESDGLTTIHRLVTEEGDSLWLQQIPSLDSDRVREGAGALGGTGKRIVSEEVPALTVATLLARHHLDRLDLLVIDTEGWDWRILRQFDLRGLRVRLVLFEHQHLPAGDRSEAHLFLEAAGFAWAEMPEGDTLAWLQPASSSKASHSSV